MCSTRVNDVIYVVSKDDGQYLLFQQDQTRNLYYMDIGDETVQLDWKWVECVRNLQEMCGSPANNDLSEHWKTTLSLMSTLVEET